MYSDMNLDDWWWDTQDQLHAAASIVPVICVSHKTYLPNFLDDQQAWPQYLRIGNIQPGICRTPKKSTSIIAGLIPCPQKGAKIIDEAWHKAVGTVLSELCPLDITGPS
jgi:hypothetical protein